MEAYPVMPTRFCTIFANEERIEELLRVHNGGISRFLSDMADKEEWGVKGYIEENRLEEDFKRLNPTVGAVDIDLEETSPGQAYLLKRKRDLAIRDDLSGIALRFTEEVFQELLTHAVKGVRNKALEVEGGDKRKQMILNAAFLVLKSGVKAFRQKIMDTEEKYRSQGLTLSLTGSWPPYNFCPVFTE
jgi:hypothetical protein